jgi:hypothetical protein
MLKNNIAKRLQFFAEQSRSAKSYPQLNAIAFDCSLRLSA